MPAEENLKTSRFTLRVWSPAPHIACTTASGHLTLEAIAPIVRCFDAVVDGTEDAVFIFHDWEKVTGYDSEARTAFVETSKGQQKRIDSVVCLTSSSIVSMAVSVANIVLNRKLSATTKRSDFDRAMAEALALHKR